MAEQVPGGVIPISVDGKGVETGTAKIVGELDKIGAAAQDAGDKGSAGIDKIAGSAAKSGDRAAQSFNKLSAGAKRAAQDIADAALVAERGFPIQPSERAQRKLAQLESVKVEPGSADDKLIASSRAAVAQMQAREKAQRDVAAAAIAEAAAEAEITRKLGLLTIAANEATQAEQRLAAATAARQNSATATSDFIKNTTTSRGASGFTKGGELTTSLGATSFGEAPKAAVGQFDYLTQAVNRSNDAVKRGEKVFNEYGISTKQTTAALRQVPAQLTDIFVSLQGGQAPLTVLLQQGGQLKDIFGGIKPAFKALAGYVWSLVGPYTAAAAAIGVFTYALYKGAEQSKAFADATVLTGNFAGQTEASFNKMAQTISASGQISVAAARDFGQAIIATGEIGPAVFAKATEAAARYGEATGKNAKEVAADFATMGQDVAKWATEHNRQLNLVSAAQMQQIRSLVEQGKTVEAQAVVYDALNKRLKDLEPNLGYLDIAIRAVTTSWSAMWDAAFDVGRTKSIDQLIKETADKLEEVRKRNAQTPTVVSLLGGGHKQFMAGGDTEEARLANQLRTYQQTKSTQDTAAAAGASLAQLNKQAAANEPFLRGIEQRGNAVSDLTRKLNEANAAFAVEDALAKKDPTYKARSQDERTKIFQQIIKDGQDKTKKDKKPIDDDKATLKKRLSDIDNILQLELDAYKNQENALEAIRSAGLLGEEDYYGAKRQFIQSDADARSKALKDQITAIDDANAELEKKKANPKLDANDRVTVNREIIANNEKRGDSERQLAKVTADASAKISLSYFEQGVAARQLAAAIVAARQAEQEALDTTNRQRARELSGVGKGQQSRAFDAGLNAIEERGLSTRQREEGLRRELEGLGKFNTEARALYEARIALSYEFQARDEASYRAYYGRLLDAQADYSNGVQRAYEDYLSEAANVAAASEKLFTDAFQGMEDALVQFVMTGQLSFKQLANTIVADITRIILKQWIANAAASASPYFGSDSTVGKFMGQLLGSKPSNNGGDAQSSAQAQAAQVIAAASESSRQSLSMLSAAADEAARALGSIGSMSAQTFPVSPGGVQVTPIDGEVSAVKSEFGMFGESLVDARTDTQKLASVLGPASAAVADLAKSGSAANFALRALPDLIRAVSAGNGGGGVGSGVGSLFTQIAGGSGSSGAMDWIGNAFISMFGMAGGGMVTGGSPQIVGERGPEVFMPSSSGVVIPNNKASQMIGGNTTTTSVTNNFTISAPIDKRTQEQIAAAAYRGVSRARARGTA